MTGRSAWLEVCVPVASFISIHFPHCRTFPDRRTLHQHRRPPVMLSDKGAVPTWRAGRGPRCAGPNSPRVTALLQLYWSRPSLLQWPNRVRKMGNFEMASAVHAGWNRCVAAQACFLHDTTDAKGPTPQIWRQLKAPHRIVQMDYNEGACGKGGGEKVRSEKEGYAL